jgi:hypothetical protein
MRTVIFIGLIAIADAIDKDWLQGSALAVYSVTFIVVVCMDVYDFFRSKK